MRVLSAVALLALTGGCLQVDVVGWSGPENPGPGDPACGASGDRDHDGISDADEGPGDADGDGIPNVLDIDSDADRIQDAVEAGDTDCRTPPVDTDGDGTPDFLDRDSDGDGILDLHEGVADPDRDGIFAFRDLDADGDGVIDRIEAGDRDPATAPVACPSFLDADSDDDGLADGEEREPALRTDPCLADTDADGRDDLHEAAWVRHACPDGSGEDCRCPTDDACAPPTDVPYRRLEAGAGPARLDVSLEARVRSMDVAVLVDVSRGDTDLVLAALRDAMRPGAGIFDRIRAAVPDLRFAVAEHSDFAFPPYGAAGDVPFRLLSPMTGVDDDDPDRAGRLALAGAFEALAARPGGDAPGSHLEALFQLATGDGGDFSVQGGPSQGIPGYAASCPPGAVGAACFRDGALPVVLHVTGSCAMGDVAGESSACGDYMGFRPMPARWDEAVAALMAAGARYVGVNASLATCERSDHPSGTAPCFVLSALARHTGAVTTDGEPVRVDVGGRVLSAIEDRLVDVVLRGVEGVPLDAVVALTLERTDPGDVGGAVSGWAETRCAAYGVARCWSSDYRPEDRAVGYADRATWYGVVPGTTVQATVGLEAPGDEAPGSRTFAAIADLGAARDQGARFDRAIVLVAVPARGW